MKTFISNLMNAYLQKSRNYLMCEFTAPYACRNAEMNLKSTTTDGFNFQIITLLIKFLGALLTLLDCKKT